MTKTIKPAGRKQGSTPPTRCPTPFVARPEALYVHDSAGGANWLRELYARPPAGQKVVLYTRSRPLQGGEGYVLPAQLEECQEWARRNRCQVVAEFQDAVSGQVKRPPEFRRAVAQATAEQAALVVYSLDRITRNLWLLFERLQYCRHRGVRVYVVR